MICLDIYGSLSTELLIVKTKKILSYEYINCIRLLYYIPILVLCKNVYHMVHNNIKYGYHN